MEQQQQQQKKRRATKIILLFSSSFCPLFSTFVDILHPANQRERERREKREERKGGRVLFSFPPSLFLWTKNEGKEPADGAKRKNERSPQKKICVAPELLNPCFDVTFPLSAEKRVRFTDARTYALFFFTHCHTSSEEHSTCDFTIIYIFIYIYIYLVCALSFIAFFLFFFSFAFFPSGQSFFCRSFFSARELKKKRKERKKLLYYYITDMSEFTPPAYTGDPNSARCEQECFTLGFISLNAAVLLKCLGGSRLLLDVRPRMNGDLALAMSEEADNKKRRQKGLPEINRREKLGATQFMWQQRWQEYYRARNGI